MPPADVRQDIEALRLCSALGIVWFHVGAPRGDIAYGGLMVFLSLSMFLGGGARNAGPQTGGPGLRRRARRLLLPWAIWCAVYGGFNLWLGRPLLATEHGLVLGWLAGTSIHLWYMPFVFGCLVGLDTLHRALSRRALGSIAAGTAIAGILAAPLWRPAALGWGEPLPQWAHAAPAVALGMFMRCAAAQPRWLSGTLTIAIVAAALVVWPVSWVGPAYLVGALAAAFVLWGGWAGPITPDLRPVSGCTLGIYFLHPLAVVALAPVGLPPGALLALLAFGTALAAVYTLRRACPAAAALVC